VERGIFSLFEEDPEKYSTCSTKTKPGIEIIRDSTHSTRTFLYPGFYFLVSPGLFTRSLSGSLLSGFLLLPMLPRGTWNFRRIWILDLCGRQSVDVAARIFSSRRRQRTKMVS
jgi:hypothetical protein